MVTRRFRCPFDPFPNNHILPVFHNKKLQTVTKSVFSLFFVTFLYPFHLLNATKIKFGCVGIYDYILYVIYCSVKPCKAV